MGLVDIEIIAKMMRYLILMRGETIFLATTPNLTQKLNYLYHLIYSQRNQPSSNGKIKLMQSYAGVGASFMSPKERQLWNSREFQKQISQYYNIEAIFERAKNMPTRPPEKELSSQLRLKNKLIQENLNNAQPFLTSCLSYVGQKEALRTLQVRH